MEWDRDEMWPKERDNALMLSILSWIGMLSVFASLLWLVGCMTVNVEHVTLTDHSTMNVSQPKTVTTTTDASIPAGALGL
jgi:hypothetical protein